MYIKCHNVYVLGCLIMLWYLLCIFFPNLFGCRDMVHICGMFSKVHVTVKVITQIAACLLGLASLLSCGLILRLAGIHPAFYVIFSCTFFGWNLRSGPLGWISGMTFGYGGMSLFHWRNLTDGTVYVTSAVRWRGTEFPMIIYHPCNLEAEHAGNPWKRKCLFWIIIFQGFKNRGNISFW